MKILYVSDARLPTEKAHGVAIMKTCEALAEAGHNVELVVPRRINSIKDDPFVYYGIQKIFPIRTLSTVDLIQWGRLGFLIQESTFALAAASYARGKGGVIYSRDYVVLWILYLCGFRNIIWESHTGPWNFAARFVARNAPALVVISDGLKAFYTEHGIPREKIHVIPSAIDLEEFTHPESKGDARRRLSLPLDKKIVLYIGRFDGWKGSATLFEASKFLPKDAVLVAIGGGPEEVEQLRKQYPPIVFLGFRPYKELSDNQSAADVLVVPNTAKDIISSRFTSPLKLIAHMASERPIVASDLPSIREITGDDAAVLVEPDDPQALAEGIKKLLIDSALAGRIAEKAREKVVQYSWKMRAERIGNILRIVA